MIALAATPALAAAGLALVAASPATARTPAMASRYATQSVSQEHFSVLPHHVNMLDCNGWSTKYASADPGFRRNCTDPRGPSKGYGGWNPAAGLNDPGAV
jgi:hypothetical protein